MATRCLCETGAIAFSGDRSARARVASCRRAQRSRGEARRSVDGSATVKRTNLAPSVLFAIGVDPERDEHVVVHAVDHRPLNRFASEAIDLTNLRAVRARNNKDPPGRLCLAPVECLGGGLCSPGRLCFRASTHALRAPTLAGNQSVRSGAGRAGSAATSRSADAWLCAARIADYA